MNKEVTNWIDQRLRTTTNLGESSALVANDLATNLPAVIRASMAPITVVAEISVGFSTACSPMIQDVYVSSGLTMMTLRLDQKERRVRWMSVQSPSWMTTAKSSCSMRVLF